MYLLDCTALVSTIYRDLNGSCVNVSHHNCTIGSLEKFQVTKWYRNMTSCPPTTPAPTVVLPTSKFIYVAFQVKTPESADYLSVGVFVVCVKACSLQQGCPACGPQCCLVLPALRSQFIDSLIDICI